MCVRDLRACFASIEKQEEKFPYFANDVNPGMQTALGRADVLFSDLGLIGLTVAGIEDLHRKNADNVVYWKYEYFIQSPEDCLRKLYSELGEPWFEHDFENIENTATDLDALTLHKFPHEGKGPVAPVKNNWEDFVPKDIADLIMEKFPYFNQAFGYV